jgi:hypothetical protein
VQHAALPPQLLEQLVPQGNLLVLLLQDQLAAPLLLLQVGKTAQVLRPLQAAAQHQRAPLVAAALHEHLLLLLPPLLLVPALPVLLLLVPAPAEAALPAG